MKIIKTTLGWEIQPETDSEEDRLAWLIDCLQLHSDQVAASAAGLDYGQQSSMRTFTTKGPIE